MLKKLGTLIILIGASFASLAAVNPQSKQAISYFDRIDFLNNAKNITLETVKNTPDSQWSKHYTKDINVGFSNDHYWFKVALKNTAPSDTPLFLRSKYPLLDTLDVYLFSGDTLVQEFHTGDALPFSQRPVAHPSYIFPLNINTHKQYTVYMHVQSAGSLQMSLSLQSESNFWQEIWEENTLRAIFYSVLLSMIVYNSFIFFMVRERTYLYYVLYLITFTMLMANLHGWAFQLFWPHNPRINEIALTFTIGMFIAATALFTSNFLRLKDVQPSAYRIIMIFAKFGVVNSIISLFAPYSVMVQATTIITAFIAAIASLITLHAVIYNRSREAVLFIVSWVTVLSGLVLYMGQKFSVFPINTLTEHTIEIGGGFVALILSLGLADRINTERKTRVEAQKKMLEIQRLANIELDQKVLERTAELKVINNKLQAASITDSLTQLKNRHYFDYKLTAEYRRAYRDQSDISLLMLDIDHFKKFNDTYGHQAGDEVLRRVASTIKHIVNRPSDTAFRYGGEEFTVLLPRTPKQGAYKIAEHIRKEIEHMPLQLQGETLSVTISIGIASCIPSDPENGAELLKNADDFLYLAKNSGRNRVFYQTKS